MIDLDFKEHELTRCYENKKELRYAQYKKQFYLYFFLPLIVLLSSLTFIRTKQLSVLIVGFLIMYYFTDYMTKIINN